MHTDERAYRVGTDGEEEVAWRMRKLGDGWHVLHSVPVGEKDSDIDHVVIGPPGVFTLNTKNHSRKKVWVAERAFMVSGQKTGCSVCATVLLRSLACTMWSRHSSDVGRRWACRGPGGR